MRGSRRDAGSVVMSAALALAALELRVERVGRWRAARARPGGTRRALPLDAHDDTGAFGETVLHLDELAVGDAGVDPHRLGLAFVVQDEDERGPPAVALGAAGRRSGGAAGIRAPSAPPSRPSAGASSAGSRPRGRCRRSGCRRPRAAAAAGPAGRAGGTATAAAIEALGAESQRRRRDA